jgi:beta-barrel assembly-enhancing protease
MPATRSSVFASVGILIALCMAIPVLGADKGKDKPKEDDEEVRIGRDAAASNDKEVKLLTEPALVDRVNKIGQEIAAIANELEVKATWGNSKVRKFNYTFKVVDDKDVNAYSLPGGFIYVHKGLLDYVHSDDELAGVLAHEVAHASHHHMVKLLREQSKMQPWALLAILVGGLSAGSGRGSNPGAIAFGAQLAMTAKLNEMGVEAEKDADQTAIRYLVKTKYNPTGLMTFMERLARDEANRPIVTLGIFQTHPASPERAQSAVAQLKELKVPIRRREVDPTLRASVSMTTLNGSTVAEVKMFKTTVARLVTLDDETAEQRGAKLAAKLDRLLDDGLQSFDVRMSKDKTRVLGAMETIVAFTPNDAEVQRSTVQQLTQSAAEAVRTILWQDPSNRPISTTGFFK